MTTFLLLKDLYLTSFEELQSKPLANLFKAMSVVCFVLLLVVMYAFLYRVLTGFAFE